MRSKSQFCIRTCSSIVFAAGIAAANSSAYAIDIMPMGDSITEGFNACSYRTPLVEALDNIASCNFSMVGTDSAPVNPPAGECTTSNNDSEGHSGFSTSNFLQVISPSTIPRIRQYLNTNTPDVVLLHIGSNDMTNGTGSFQVGTYNSNTNQGTFTLGRIVQMIDEIYNSNANAEVFVANLIPWYADTATNNRINQLRSVITSMVADRRSDGDAITLVPVSSGFNQSMMQDDGVHPNSAGELHIATRFLNAMQSEGICESQTSAPGQVTLVSPSESIETATPQYRWNAQSTATNYFLWVNDFTGNRIQQTFSASQAGCANGSGTCQVTPNTAITNGPAYWWVQASNAAGSGQWSSRASFFAGGATPPRATLLQPSGSVGNNPTYSWTAVSNSTWYYIWIDDGTGTQNIVRRWYTAAQAGCATGPSTCSINPTESSAGSGTWWIKTWNPNGFGPWSVGSSFD